MKLTEFTKKIIDMTAYTAPEIKENMSVMAYDVSNNILSPIDYISLGTDKDGNVILVINTYG